MTKPMPKAQQICIASYHKLNDKRVVGVYTSERNALAAIRADARGFGLDERWYGVEFARLDVDAWADNAPDDGADEEGTDHD